jgi:hypothetical protein
MEQYIAPILGALAYGFVTFGLGYIVGKLGISKIETDISQIKSDISNFHFQTPFTITPTVIDITNPTSPVLPSTGGKAVDTPSVVAHI